MTSAVTPDGTKLYVDPVPEPRTGGTRVHLDLRLPAPDPGPLVAAGATLQREPDGEVRWWVLSDPDGNEFCAFPPGPETPEPPDGALVHVYELVVGAADAPAQAVWWAYVLGGIAGHAGLFGTAEGVGDFARDVLKGLAGEETFARPETFARFARQSTVPGS